MTFFILMCNKCSEWHLREIDDEEMFKRYTLKCNYCNRSSKVYSSKHGWRVNFRKCHSREDALEMIKVMKDKKKVIYKYKYED